MKKGERSRGGGGGAVRPKSRSVKATIVKSSLVGKSKKLCVYVCVCVCVTCVLKVQNAIMHG